MTKAFALRKVFSVVEVGSILEIENHLDGIKAVIFDMDDTLYGEKEYVRSGYAEIARLLPQVENAKDKLWDFFEQKKNAIDELLVSEGIYSDELKEKCLKVYRFQSPQIHLYSGVSELLLKLRSKNYKIGIITDGRVEGQQAKIKALGLEALADKIIITDALGGIEFRKPNPKAYEMMKEFFNVSYSEMVYTGDNIKKDFIACEALGIKAVYFNNPDGLYTR